MVKPGAVWADIENKAVEMITQGLLDMGVLVGNYTIVRQLNLYKFFYPHGLGHTVGLDVHDFYGLPGVLQKNMVLTVEPGCYFNSIHLKRELFTNEQLMLYVNKQRTEELLPLGGVRLEDTVVVTAEGSSSLTDAIKGVDAIEEMMAD